MYSGVTDKAYTQQKSSQSIRKVIDSTLTVSSFKVEKMAISWLTALKIVPWGKVLEHAPGVLEKARGFVDKRRTDEVPAPTELEQLSKVQQEMAHTLAQLAEQNNALMTAVQRLQLRLKWLSAVTLLTLCVCGVLVTQLIVS
jgi:hypothetical protein